MQEFKNKILSIVDDYNTQFAEFGIKIDLSKKYFETPVMSRRISYIETGAGLIDQHFDDIKERKYKNEKNKYHCMVLTVLPISKKIVHHEYCKNYSFIIRKVERAHIGKKPQHIIYEENKLLVKIEKKLKKILKKAHNKSVAKVCKDTIFDAFRYCNTHKYAYKKRILGKNRAFWEILFTAICLIISIMFFILAKI